ncbi:primase alpha helix C-terminal domain-containing protein [Ureibacillus sinduriensis]|uniref:primase alpha helix C-terminal domain-containing protein n=1 Tax=Ureibacillus sinduriensis TaxID=561440 RepID=UPI00215C51A0|nr:primase alpha helix C-terminal domain-containing protein [Ureibacillus sinduriensis]
MLEGVNEGERNNAATSLVGYLFRRYVDPEIIIGFVEMWNRRNNPPLSSEELEKVIISIGRKEQVRRNLKSGEF